MKKIITLLFGLISLAATAQPPVKLQDGTELNWQPASETVTWTQYPFVMNNPEKNYAWQVQQYGQYDNGRLLSTLTPDAANANERFAYLSIGSAFAHANSPDGNFTYLASVADQGHTMMLHSLLTESASEPYDGWIKILYWAATLDTKGEPDDIYIFTVDNKDTYRVLKLQRLK